MVMAPPAFGVNRAKSTQILNLGVVYESYDNLFTLKINHNGYFTSPPYRRYSLAVVDWYDLVNSEMFTINEYGSLLEDLGFKDGRILFSHFRIPGKSLDEGLTPLMSDEDVLSLLKYIPTHREIEVYVEIGVSSVEKQMMEVRLDKGKGVLTEEMVEDDDVEYKNEASTSKFAQSGEGWGTSLYGFSDSDSSDQQPWSSECIDDGKTQQRWGDEFQFSKLLSETVHVFDLDLNQDPIEKADHGMEADLHTLNDYDLLDDLDFWLMDNNDGDDFWLLDNNDGDDFRLQDNNDGDSEVEETAQLFAELDHLLEHVAFLNVELRESVVDVDPPVVHVAALVIPFEEEIQRPKKKKREMEDESASGGVAYERPNKRRRLLPAENGVEDKAMEPNGLDSDV